MKKFNLSGVIGWDVTADDMREFFSHAGGTDVEVVVSSPGGLVGEALEMFNLVRNYPGTVTAVLSGYAMSAASYIPLAADEIVAEDNAVYMIHNVHGGVFGDHNYILKYGRETEGLSRLLAGAYVNRTGATPDDIRSMMDEETFFYGQEIVDSGFADRVKGGSGDDDRENILTIARTAFKECGKKINDGWTAAADDWVRAVALAGDLLPDQPGKKKPAKKANWAATPAKKKKEHSMDLKTLKKEHPDLVAALNDEYTAGLNHETLAITSPDLVEKIMQAGAESERNRIADVRAQLIGGHEDLIAAMELDGKSTGADAAKAIILAEKDLRKTAAANMQAEANDLVPPANPDAGEKKEITRQDFNALSVAAQRNFVQDGGVVKD